MKNTTNRCWLLPLIIQALFFARSQAECVYLVNFRPRNPECNGAGVAKAVSVLVEIGNEAQEFIMWGQADLKHPQGGCGETQLKLTSSSSCMREICQLRLIRFLGDSKASTGDWLLSQVSIQAVEKKRPNKNPVVFNITGPISVDGQASVGSCVEDLEDDLDAREEEREQDAMDEVGDIDWS